MGAGEGKKKRELLGVRRREAGGQGSGEGQVLWERGLAEGVQGCHHSPQPPQPRTQPPVKPAPTDILKQALTRKPENEHTSKPRQNNAHTHTQSTHTTYTTTHTTTHGANRVSFTRSDSKNNESLQAIQFWSKKYQIRFKKYQTHTFRLKKYRITLEKY